MLLMRKGESKTLTGTNTTAQFPRGAFTVPKGQAAIAALFKVRVTITKAAGDAALTAAQQRTFLQGFDLTMTWGFQQQHNPYNKVTFLELRDLVRNGLGSDMEGYNNATTGLGQTFTAGGLEATFYLRVPFTALGWQDQTILELPGVGPTQAQTMVFELRRNTVTLPTNFAISGSVTLDIIPECVPCGVDKVTPIPHFQRTTHTERIINTLAPGFYALIFETTAAHASTSMTDVTLQMEGQEPLYDKVSPAELIVRYDDTRSYFPSEADISDLYTIIWAVPPGANLASLPVGKPIFTQNTHSLATLNLCSWYYPLVPPQAVEADLREFSKLRGNERLYAVSCGTLFKVASTKAQQFALPFALFGDADRESEQYSSLATPGPMGPVQVTVPASIRERFGVLRQLKALEPLSLEDDVQEVALAVPYAVQSTRGLKVGSAYLDVVRQLLS
jgi:hypothetical protein